MQFDLSLPGAMFSNSCLCLCVTVIHITDTHTLIPVVLTTQIFLFGGRGEGVVKCEATVHALKTYRETGGIAVLVINLGAI